MSFLFSFKFAQLILRYRFVLSILLSLLFQHISIVSVFSTYCQYVAKVGQKLPVQFKVEQLLDLESPDMESETCIQGLSTKCEEAS